MAQGLEAAEAVPRGAVRGAAELADSAAKPTREFPVYLDYTDDAYDAVAAAVTDELAKALTIADKQERETELDRIKDSPRSAPPRRSRVARRRSARRTAR